MKKAINAYKTTGTQSSIAYANPHKLIDMLLTGAIDNLSQAKGHIDRDELGDKHAKLMKAFDIVEALKCSLAEENNDIKNQLFDLYSFCIDTLIAANLKSDNNLIDSVIEILSTIREGWRGIPKEMHGKKSSGITSSSIAEGNRIK